MIPYLIFLLYLINFSSRVIEALEVAEVGVGLKLAVVHAILQQIVLLVRLSKIAIIGC